MLPNLDTSGPLPFARHARPKGMVPTLVGSAFFDRGSEDRCCETSRMPCQNQRNPLRSLALPVGLPFSFATFLLGKQKKSRDVKQMLG
jgi:hypothetical protein